MNRSTSLYLDIVRPLAAFVVLLSHVSDASLSGGQLRFMHPFGTQAVDVFFVLSGFVIAHVTSKNERDARTYAVSRAARIYSVAIPALVLVVVLDAIGTHISPSTYHIPFQPFSPGLLVRSLFFIGEEWNVHRFPGSDGPYWSLGFEVWYYIAFGLLLFAPRGWRLITTAAALLFIGPKVTAMFPAWLLGVATYSICTRQRLSRGLGWTCVFLPLLLFAGLQFVRQPHLQAFMPISMAPLRLLGTLQDWFIALLFSVHLIGIATISDTFDRPLEKLARPIRWVAGGTFSLYLTHLPIMCLLAALSPWPKSSPATVMLLVLVTPLASFAFAELSERQKNAWRRQFARVAAAVSGLTLQGRGL